MDWLRIAFCSIFAGLVLAGAQSHAISCTTQAEMKEADRTSLAAAVHVLAGKVQSGDAAAVKGSTIPTVANDFTSIAGSIETLTPLLAGATLDVTSIYDLQATDAKPNQDEVEFFCGEAANAPHVTFTIPQLPPGHYAFAIVQATGIKQPQRLSFLLQQTGSWQLAGFFPRPLLSAGHDGVWYWQKARAYAKAGQLWDAYFYYQTSAYLLLPADFVGSSNFEKLIQEETAATPPGLPGAQPMTINAGDAAIEVTNLHTDSSFGGLDLVVNYNTADVSEPAAARIKTVALMKALLALHPELKEAFHGLWVFAHAPGQPPFALELPMAEIAAQS
jgi:hypothetical protein